MDSYFKGRGRGSVSIAEVEDRVKRLTKGKMGGKREVI